MTEIISSLQNWNIPAPAELVVPVAVFTFIMLIAIVLSRTGRTHVVRRDDLEAEARRWVEDRIDDYAHILAEASSKAGTSARADELPPGFGVTVETFIAEVLQRERDGANFDIDLSVAVREFIVLHRAELYEYVAARTRRHLDA